MSPEKENAGALADLRVLDLAGDRMGPCSRILSSLGARIIRLTEPGDTGQGSFNRVHALQWISGMDGKRDPGKSRILESVRHCDVVIEAFEPGALDARGIGFSVLREVNPGLVMVSITGFGQTGPRKHHRSCDLVAAATGGQMVLSGSPSRLPLKAYGQQAYFGASLYAAIGALLAVRSRRCTGTGAHIDISLQETVASALDHVMVRYHGEKIITRRNGSRHWTHFFCILPCRDGHISISPFLEWETLVDLMDAEGAAMDLKESRWHDVAHRTAHAGHVIDVLAQWTRTHRKAWLFELGQLMRLPWAPVQSVADVLACPQLASRAFFVHRPHPEKQGAVLKLPGLPFKWTTSAARPHGVEPARVQKPIQGHVAGGGGILSGVRVLDFSRVLAGPFATRLLADFGAEVIKVQSAAAATGAEDNSRAQFRAVNRNKRGISLNMNRPEARQIALKLVAVSDVVLENFSPRVMDNWEMDFEKLRHVKKDLIMVRMSGMGQTGPWRDFAAYGPTVQALGGLDGLTAYAPGEPLGLGYAHADVVSGLYAAMAVLAALHQRDRAGGGQYVDLSEYEAVCTLIGETLVDAQSGAGEGGGRPTCSEQAVAAPWGCYRCRGDDRWCVIAVFTDEQWAALCRVTGETGWCTHPDFSSFAGRKAHAAELDDLLEQWTASHTAEDVVDRLQTSGIPAGVVQHAADLARDPHLKQRDFFREIVHPDRGNTLAGRSPIRFSGHPDPPAAPAPFLGEHNRYVYRDLLGLAEDEYAFYDQSGIFS